MTPFLPNTLHATKYASRYQISCVGHPRMMLITELPRDVLARVLSFVPTRDLATRLRYVSKTMDAALPHLVDSRACQLLTSVHRALRFLRGIARADRAGRFGVAHNGDFAKWALDPLCIFSVLVWRVPRSRRFVSPMSTSSPHPLTRVSSLHPPPRGRAPYGKVWDEVHGGFVFPLVVSTQA